jgi:hypothetical protein
MALERYFMQDIVHLFIRKLNSFVENYIHGHGVYTHDLQKTQGHSCLFSFFLAAQILHFFSFASVGTCSPGQVDPTGEW